MTESENEEWRKYKQDKLIRKRKYDRSEIPSDFNMFHEKKVILDDEMLKIIWMIKKRHKGLRNEKQIVRLALRHYLENEKQG